MTIRTENPVAYRAWLSMRARCDNSDRRDYQWYGARGIRYVDRWRKFENFIADMGECPLGFSLERRRVNGHYGPYNCIWIPKADQALNRRLSYNPLSGIQVGSLEALFPPLDNDLPEAAVHSLRDELYIRRRPDHLTTALPLASVLADGPERERRWRSRYIIIRRRTGWWITLSDDPERYIAGPFTSRARAQVWKRSLA